MARVRFPVPASCGLSLLLVLVLAPRVFLRVLWFSSLHKNQHFPNSILIWNQWTNSHLVEMPLQIPIYFILFIYFCLFAELPCCRPCQNTGGYLANISLPTTCESPAKDCEKLGARCCRGPRVEGCSCPLGTYFDGKKCVNQTEKCSRPCVGSTTSVTSSTASSVSSTSSIRCVIAPFKIKHVNYEN